MNNAWWHRLLFSKTKSGYSTQVTSKVCHTGMRMSLPKTEVKILSTSPLQVLYLIIFSIWKYKRKKPKQQQQQQNLPNTGQR